MYNYQKSFYNQKQHFTFAWISGIGGFKNRITNVLHFKTHGIIEFAIIMNI